MGSNPAHATELMKIYFKIEDPDKLKIYRETRPSHGRNMGSPDFSAFSEKNRGPSKYRGNPVSATIFKSNVY